MHHILAPPRLAVVKALAGQGTLSIRKVARRINREVHAVHRDVTMLVDAGVIDRHNHGIEFP
jgi:predicted transcriptional regulator